MVVAAALDPELDLLPVPMPPGTAFGHDLYVAPCGARDAASEARWPPPGWPTCAITGFRRLRRLVAADNAASWRTAERSAPSEVVGEVWFVKTPGRCAPGSTRLMAESAYPT